MRSTAWPRPTGASACASSPGSASCARPIARPWSGASSRPCSTACAAATPTSTIPRRCAASGLPPNIEVTEFFLQAGAWLSNAGVQQSYTSLNYSHVAAHLARIGSNVFGQLVAPDPQGHAPHQPQLQHRRHARHGALRLGAAQAGQPLALAVEINANLPYMPGEAEVDLGAVRRRAGGGAPALRPVRAAQGAGVARRLRHGAACGDAHQGRRHAADRHRLVLGRADARADPAPHAQR